MDIKSKRNRHPDKTPWLRCLLPGILLSVPMAQHWMDARGYGSPALLRPLVMTVLLLPGAAAMWRLIRRRPYEGRLWPPESLLLFFAAWILWGETGTSVMRVIFRAYSEGMLMSEDSAFIIGSYMVSGGTLVVLELAVCMLPLSYGLSVCLYHMAQLGKRHEFCQRSILYRWGLRLWQIFAGGKGVRRQALGEIAVTAFLTAILSGVLIVGLTMGSYGTYELSGQALLILLSGPAAVLALGLILALRLGRSQGLMSQVESLQRQIQRLYERGAPEERAEELLPSDSPLYISMEQLCHISETLKESVRQAVAGEKLKVELLANVSHDLKTPLTAIIGYGERLAGEELPPAAREYVERLNHKAAYLYDVVQDVFELSKISSGAAAVEMTRLDVKKLWEQTIGGMDEELKSSQLTLRRRYAGQSFWIQGDGARLHRVFQNLLDNALKYSLPGSRIYLTVEGTGGAGTDGGEGDVGAGAEEEVKEGMEGKMAENPRPPLPVKITLVNTASYEIRFDAETITGRFVRGDAARTGEGSGLGLAIASTFTQACGGTFSVETDYDQFRVSMEFLPAD